MHQLGNQWIELIDGAEHMVKAVEGRKICEGCLYNGNGGNCEREEVGNACGSFIIKDLGILNKDGCLPNCWGEYPRVEGVVDSDIKTKRYRCVTRCGIYCATELYRTEQQAKDAWNRRA